jgi:hypothetical protein
MQKEKAFMSESIGGEVRDKRRAVDGRTALVVSLDSSCA